MEINRNYVLIIITIINNITVLVPHNVICFKYFMPMSHGDNKNRPSIVSLSPFPLTWFSQGLLDVSKEILFKPSFALIKLLSKIMHFQSKTNFFFQLIDSRFWLCCFVFTCFVFKSLCHSSVIMKLQIASYLHICKASYLVSH